MVHTSLRNNDNAFDGATMLCKITIVHKLASTGEIMKLQESVVVITGASSGIGAETARELAHQGAIVVLAARRAEELKVLADEIDPSGKRVLVVPTDVSSKSEIDHLMEAAVQRFGHIDVLVNNAGVGSGGRDYMGTEDADTERMMTINLLGPIRCARAAIPYMRKQGSGAIVNIGSVGGEIALPGPYGASKFGVRGFNEGLRRELLRDHIAVTLIEPGFIRTPLTKRLKMRMPGPEIVARAIAQVIQHPRRKMIVPWYYGVAIRLAALFPFVVDRVMRGPDPNKKAQR